MLTVLSATTKKSIRRPLATLYSQMSQTRNGITTNRTQDGTPRKPVSIPFASRLIEGRALAEDVWSIFKYVIPPLSILDSLGFDAMQCCQPTRGLP
jgi:hypothetical protein